VHMVIVAAPSRIELKEAMGIIAWSYAKPAPVGPIDSLCGLRERNPVQGYRRAQSHWARTKKEA